MSTLGPMQATGRGRAFVETQSHHSIAIEYSTHRPVDASNRKKVSRDPTRRFLVEMRTAGTGVASGVDRHQRSRAQRRRAENTPNNRHAPWGPKRPRHVGRVRRSSLAPCDASRSALRRHAMIERRRLEKPPEAPLRPSQQEGVDDGWTMRGDDFLR